MSPEATFVDEVIARSERLDARDADPARAAARARLRAAGLPSGRKLEAWKYTPIAAFYRSEFAEFPAPRPSALALTGDAWDQGGLRVVRNASDVAAATDRLDFERHPLAAVTAALADDTVTVEVDRGAVIDAPLEILTRIAGGAARCSRVVLRLGANSRAVLRERQAAAAPSCQIVQIDIGPGAVLHHERIEERSPVPCWSLVSVDVADDGAYEGALYPFAGAPRRTDMQVFLRGAGARVDLTGACAAAAKDVLDLNVVVEHLGARTICRERFHGIAAGHGTLTFNGRIEIHPSAAGADAELTNRNLLLAPTAKVNAKPELEIHNRDVRCSHGATVGQLDPRQIFYLRSRGIDLENARSLLLRAFIAQCLTPAALEAGVDREFARVVAEALPS